MSDAVHLNTGTFGPSPTMVFDAIRQALDLIERHGPYSPLVRQAVERESYEQTRSQAADLLGALPDEIALTRSASDGASAIANGLDWRPGDEVVISDEEHQSGIMPWLVLSQRQGVRVRVASLHPDPAVFLQNIDDLITPRTRLIFVSHVSCISGTRLPVAAICRLAHERGTVAVIDGAHALGQFPVDVRAIGCDAYVGCGHKWLLGPQGTSFSYIAAEHLHTFQPSWTGWGAQVEHSLDLSSQTFAWQESARRFEFGTKQWSLFPGLQQAISFISQIGTAAIEEHVRPAAARLKGVLAAIPSWQLLTPMAPERSSGLVTIRLPQTAPTNIKEILWERQRLLVAYFLPKRTLRLSVAFFTTGEEIDRALSALEALPL